MKQLILIRHAKSDWSHNGIRDIDRSLNQRGNHDAPRMAEHFSKLFHPEIWYVSPALRAQQTAAYFLNKQQQHHITSITEQALYSFDLNTVIQLITQFDNKYVSAALVYHNPTISETAHYFCNHFTEQVPTCAVVVLSFSVDQWQHLSADTAELSTYDYPKRHDWAFKS